MTAPRVSTVYWPGCHRPRISLASCGYRQVKAPFWMATETRSALVTRCVEVAVGEAAVVGKAGAREPRVGEAAAPGEAEAPGEAAAAGEALVCAELVCAELGELVGAELVCAA